MLFHYFVYLWYYYCGCLIARGSCDMTYIFSYFFILVYLNFKFPAVGVLKINLIAWKLLSLKMTLTTLVEWVSSKVLLVTGTFLKYLFFFLLML